MKQLYNFSFRTALIFICLLNISTIVAAGGNLSSTKNATSKRDKPIPQINGFNHIQKTYGDGDFNLTGITSNSSGSITFSIDDTNIAEINGNRISIINSGTAQVTLTQAETDNYQAASLKVLLSVAKAQPTLTLLVDFEPYTATDIVKAEYGDVRFFMLETNSDVSLSNVEFDLLDDYLDPYIDFSDIPFIKAIKLGTTTLEVRLPETRNFLSAKQQLTLEISKRTITVEPRTNQFKYYGQNDPYLTYNIYGLLDGDEFYIELKRELGEDAGNYLITLANTDDYENYEFVLASDPVYFEVKKATQTITFPAIQPVELDGTEITLNATVSTNLDLSFSSSDNDIAQIYFDAQSNSWKLKPIAVGVVEITALQAGTNNYEAATASRNVQIKVTTLPVTLKDLNLKALTNGALLSWSTLNEENNSRFEIQRSTNGVDFQTIKTLIGAGNKSTLTNYQYLDERPFKGLNYYRLIQIDQNGKVNNLGVKHLNYHLSTPEITVYPNPTTSVANINFEKNVFQSFTLSDLNGRTVQSSKIREDETSIVLKLDNYAKGVYVLKLLGRAAVTTKKIIRK